MAVRKILGINTGHNGGCALCIDGRIIVAITEERLTRVKDTAGWQYAMKYCLTAAGLSLQDIDLVVFSSYRDPLPDNYDGGLSVFGFPKNRCVSVDHHLSHACSVFFTSPFNKAMIFIYDSHGNGRDTESFYIGDGTIITKAGGNPMDNPKNGIVRAYESFTNYFGWISTEAGKTMGLASYGDKEKNKSYPIFGQTPEGRYFSLLEDSYSDGVEKLCMKYNLDVPPKFSSTNPLDYKDMAAWIQAEFERAVIGTIDNLYEENKMDLLCLGGGGALNSVCNTEILSKTAIRNIHILPASSDAGQCIGNALWGYYIYGCNPRNNNVWQNDFTGIIYDSSDIEERLIKKRGFRDNTVSRSPKYSFKKLSYDSIPKIVAKYLSDGKIIGWFQGGSELGPRALGHRSIICDPRIKNIKDMLNSRVKHRESFRPFAVAVLEENSSDFFDLPSKSPFMLFVAKVKNHKKDFISGVIHIDGTCRIQTLSKKDNDLFHSVVEEFYKISGVPMVLNTSFNVSGEPLVETPTNAMQCFLKTDIDILVMNEFIINKL